MGKGTEEEGSGLMGVLKWGKESKHLCMFEEIEENVTLVDQLKSWRFFLDQSIRDKY